MEEWNRDLIAVIQKLEQEFSKHSTFKKKTNQKWTKRRLIVSWNALTKGDSNIIVDDLKAILDDPSGLQKVSNGVEMTIKAFGYVLKIQFFKKVHPEPNSGFSGHFHDKGIKLKVENGFFVVVDKNGDHIPVQTKLKLIDKINEVCKVKVTILMRRFL